MKNELKANELRIGNLVTDKDGEVLEVFNILQSYVRVYIDNELEDLQLSYSDLKPIPLTEEWLLKFSFKYQNEEHKYWMSIIVANQKTETRISIVIRDEEDKCRFDYDRYGDGKELNCPKYVHQLQNLYFALTGEELELK